mgnify:CR=1 FL=1
MFHWFQTSRTTPQLSRSSSLQRESVEFFPQAQACRVTSPISVLSKGRVIVNGCSWKAELDEQDFQLTLLPDQPAFAIGRRGLVMIVVPDRCLI